MLKSLFFKQLQFFFLMAGGRGTRVLFLLLLRLKGGGCKVVCGSGSGILKTGSVFLKTGSGFGSGANLSGSATLGKSGILHLFPRFRFFVSYCKIALLPMVAIKKNFDDLTRIIFL